MVQHYKEAIDIISAEDVNWKALVVEIAKQTPESLVSAYIELNKPCKEKWQIICKQYVENQEKIAAIKHCRSVTGMGLKEAKEAVEAL